MIMVFDTGRVSRAELLEYELWLLALCWQAGWDMQWDSLHHWVEGLVRTYPIRVRA